MTRSKLAALFLWLLPALGVADDAAVSRIASLLARHDVVRVSFEQKKTIAALSKPLTSAGTMLFAKGLGIIWNTDRPFRTRLIITPRGVYREENGSVSSVLRGSESRAAEHFSRTFLSLFSGDLSDVEQGFTIEATTTGDAWSLHLLPSRDAVRRVIREIVLSGAEEPTKMLLDEASGDRTEIVFDPAHAAYAPLSAEERTVLQQERE